MYFDAEEVGEAGFAATIQDVCERQQKAVAPSELAARRRIVDDLLATVPRRNEAIRNFALPRNVLALAATNKHWKQLCRRSALARRRTSSRSTATSAASPAPPLKPSISSLAPRC